MDESTTGSPSLPLLFPLRIALWAVTVAVLATWGASRAAAEALLVVEADSGKVLHAEQANYPWYPASLTKMMTAYVVLQAVKERRISLDSLLTVSHLAAVQKPTKMGLKPGMQVTVDNALKMLMVKSANDVAVTLAEGVSGSVEAFADEMNLAAARLGMTQSSFVNPNGMPADDQISSARDLAILARALFREFPEYELYWRIPAIRYNNRVMQNHNKLIGRFPGANGIKTGFICASGFNLVASATRKGRRLIVVVLGSPSSKARDLKAAELLERGFNSGGLAWLAPSLGTVEALPPIAASPPNLRDIICSPNRKRPPTEDSDDDELVTAEGASAQPSFRLSLLGPANFKASSLFDRSTEPAYVVDVYTGPARKPAESQFATARAKLNKNSKTAAKGKANHPSPAATAQSAPTGQSAAAAGANTALSFAPVALPPEFAPSAKPAAVPAPRQRPKNNAKPQ